LVLIVDDPLILKGELEAESEELSTIVILFEDALPSLSIIVTE
jgi:hypothetical protein